MIDQQIYYWPEKFAMICISLYMDGTFKLESDDVSEEELTGLADECMNQIMEPEEYLFVKGLSFIDHIPVI